MQDELVCRANKERSLVGSVQTMVNDIEDLQEVWDTLDTCYDRPEKYIAEVLDPIVKFRKYGTFENGAIREFYSLLRAAMMGARKAGLLHRLINDLTLPSIMELMPLSDWNQWAKERPVWAGGMVEDAFWNFVDQKWMDFLNVSAAEPASWDQGAEYRGGPEGPKRGKGERTAAKKGPSAGGDRLPRKCKFAELTGCSGSHPSWLCKVFGKKTPEDRSRIIADNMLHMSVLSTAQL